MQKAKRIWIDGKFIPWDSARVHVLTHTLHYGSGVFEGMRCYATPRGPAIFRLKDHMKRFFESARIHKIRIPYSQERLEEVAKELVRTNKLRECYIRPIAFYGYGDLKLSPLGCPIRVAMAAFPFGAYLGEKGLKRGVRCKLSSWQRISSKILPPQAKCCANYANSILAYLEAKDCGYDEAIMVDDRGNISEGPGENVFAVRDGKLLTPPIESDILRGITRHSIIHIAKDMGITVVERHIPREEIYVVDEAFFSGTAAEVTPIVEIDGRKIGKGRPGRITRMLQGRFFDVVRGKVKEYEGWLDYV